MAHYAFLDDNNIVTEVIVGKDESNMDWENYYSMRKGQVCKRTSYNTYHNSHPNGTPFRGNYAGVGYSYDSHNDVFIPPQPYNSWTLNTSIWDWEAPVPLPSDADTKPYVWNETTQSWDEVTE